MNTLLYIIEQCEISANFLSLSLYFGRFFWEKKLNVKKEVKLNNTINNCKHVYFNMDEDIPGLIRRIIKDSIKQRLQHCPAAILPGRQTVSPWVNYFCTCCFKIINISRYHRHSMNKSSCRDNSIPVWTRIRNMKFGTTLCNGSNQSLISGKMMIRLHHSYFDWYMPSSAASITIW